MSAIAHPASVAIGHAHAPGLAGRTVAIRATQALDRLAQLIRPLWRFVPAGMSTLRLPETHRDPAIDAAADPSIDQRWADSFLHSLHSR